MNSIMLIDKPEGITSQDAVTLVKRRTGAKKAGHTGTLDPIATGLLIVCLNEATKLSRFMLDLPKSYYTVLKLGERTDTYDAEGKIIATAEIPGREKIEQALGAFRGKIKQVPPMFSALKIAGTPLYKLARKGVEVEREPRDIEIYSLELADYNPPYAGLSIKCSRGAYVRSLADDIGIAAGSFAHIKALRRTGIGPFNVENAISPDGIEKGFSPAGGRAHILNIDSALSFMEELELDQINAARARNGAPFKVARPAYGFVRLKARDGALVGIGEARGTMVRVERLFNL
ncbi:MAG: tRNA pseudouridine(55) synthase TruB [Nitrospiraceae bacterium]|nr:tRNA pseudouridine(55) synthase TruB [Nitrospiraceae bacterium]